MVQLEMIISAQRKASSMIRNNEINRGWEEIVLEVKLEKQASCDGQYSHEATSVESVQPLQCQVLDGQRAIKTHGLVFLPWCKL